MTGVKEIQIKGADLPKPGQGEARHPACLVGG